MKNFAYLNGYDLTSDSDSDISTPSAATPDGSIPCTSNRIDSDADGREIPQQFVNGVGRVPCTNNRIVSDNDDQELPQQNVNGVGRVDEVFVVERILAKKIVDGVIYYKIKWKDYNKPEDDTWEVIDNCHCIDLIKEYEEAHKRDKVEVISTKRKETRGRKRKFRKSMSNYVAKQQKFDHVPRQIPFVEKEEYFLNDEGAIIDTILGFSRLPDNAIMMALVCYLDGRIEYIPVDLLRQNEIGKERLLDFLLQRVHFSDI
ncbi:hypothetical protein ACQ4LE_003906 [Meloidogyne hapla]|uniref:Chromo domain-containing protein n=1 Tax=Meloidogyne hapla TaxID=6305 RepID=A0A1I8BC39_MELHA